MCLVNMSYKRCCIPGCSGTAGADNVLHEFPNPAKDLNRFKTWIDSIGGDILKLSNLFIYKNRRVCNMHFESKYHCRHNRLSNIAVPTLNMPCIPGSTDSGGICEASTPLLSNVDSHPEPSIYDQQQKQPIASERVPTEDNSNIRIVMPILSLDQDAVSSIKSDHVNRACGTRKPLTIKLVRTKPAMAQTMQGSRNKTLKPYSKEAGRKIRDLQLEILRLRRRCKFVESKLEDAQKLTDNKTYQTTTNITLPPNIFAQIYVTRPDLSHTNSHVHQVST